MIVMTAIAAAPAAMRITVKVRDDRSLSKGTATCIPLRFLAEI
jgi:hypothetical protein